MRLRQVSLFLLASVSLCVLALAFPPSAISQIGYLAGVRLQPSTPGTPDAGHANISGTLISSAVQTGAFLMPAGAANSLVLTSDASGNGTWMPATGLSLPFAGSGDDVGSLFAVTNSNSSGSAISGISSSGSGFAAGVYGETSSPFGRGVYGRATGNGSGVFAIGGWGVRAFGLGTGV